MTAADYLMLISMVCIWALMAINVFLSVGGFLYYHQCSKTDGHVPIDEYPFVSIMVPAHNESVVIRRTVRALLNFDYPHDRYEIIVINDNSTDDTANVLKQIQAANPGRNLIVVNTDNVVGGKGKSNALNIGYSVAKGSVFAIYDADNTPEPQALRILVENLMSDSSLGAVIGKFRTRNRNASLLTRFVNIETLAHQCMNQRMYGTSEFQVAAETDLHVVQSAFQRADCHKVCQRLGRMLMTTVSGIDYRNGRIFTGYECCTFLGMTHCTDVGEAADHANRIGYRLTLCSRA